MSFTYEYPRPAVTVDIILISKSIKPKLLLIQRKFDPFKEHWAFPGGFLEMEEDLHMAALRELEEETSIKNISLRQYKTYGSIDRDPRGRTITVIYYAFINGEINAIAMDDASNTEWVELDSIPKLAFDHHQILDDFRTDFCI